MEKIKRFMDLNVWKKAHELALKTYEITKDFPSEEKFGLVSQMRRSAVSVAANIAEGFKRRSTRDKTNFYNMSQSSLTELQYYVILAKDLKYIVKFEIIENLIEEVGKMLNGLISVIEESP